LSEVIKEIKFAKYFEAFEVGFLGLFAFLPISSLPAGAARQ